MYLIFRPVENQAQQVAILFPSPCWIVSTSTIRIHSKFEPSLLVSSTQGKTCNLNQLWLHKLTIIPGSQKLEDKQITQLLISV